MNAQNNNVPLFPSLSIKNPAPITTAALLKNNKIIFNTIYLLM
jgi:hypothetical protein